MSLENLLKTKQLQPHDPTREAAQRLLQAAARNIADARVEKISGENRFDAAYKAIMQCAMVALWANRYRLPPASRGIIKYEVDPISDQAVIECIKQAEQLYKVVTDWIATNRPDLT